MGLKWHKTDYGYRYPRTDIYIIRNLDATKSGGIKTTFSLYAGNRCMMANVHSLSRCKEEGERICRRMGRNPEAEENRQKWHKEHTKGYYIRCNKYNDKDIIDVLQCSPAKSDLIKSALREYILNHRL